MNPRSRPSLPHAGRPHPPQGLHTGMSHSSRGRDRSVDDERGAQMKAAVWQGRRDVRVETVPDPKIEEPTDAIVRITSSGLCGSDLHLIEVMSPFMTEGDILGHEPMGIVEEVGSSVSHIAAGDRVVIPFNISCGHCCDVRPMVCNRSARPRRSTSTTRGHHCSATRSCTARCRVGKPSTCVCRRRSTGRSRYRTALPTIGSCSSPTCSQRPGRPSSMRRSPTGGTVVVLGLGPIGAMSCRIALHRGASKVIGVDLVPDRLEQARLNGADVLDLRQFDGSSRGGDGAARSDRRPRP